jgi:hypothetical protein
MSDGIKTIYNEGRVVGASAYEIYVRNFYANDPNSTPPTEQTWLANMFGSGSAMILKINRGTPAGVQDFALPSKSVLCGAKTLFASVFNGDCTWSDTAASSATGAVGYWAVNVSSYGGLIQNTETSHPDSTSIPYGDSIFDNPDDLKTIANYCTIAEGIVIQQGDWEHNPEVDNPYEDLKHPSVGVSPAIVRFYLTKPLTSDVKIIITGFMDSEFVNTLGNKEGSIDPTINGSVNGDFLGPAVFPWASKIIMIQPTMALLAADLYARQLPQGILDSTSIGSYSFAGQTSTEDSQSIIDLDTTDPNTYYQVNSAKYGTSVIPVNVTNAETIKDGFNILAVLEPGMTVDKANAAYQSANPDAMFFPPALYARKVSQTGSQNMVPIDTAAPGTVKVFATEEEAENYPKQLPNNYAFYYNPSTGDLTFYNKDGNATDGPITTDLSVEKISNNDSKAIRGVVSACGDTLKVIALSDEHGNLYPTTGTSSTKTISTANIGISWNDLLDALANNKKIDVLGSALKAFRDNLPNITITGDIQAANGKFTNSVASPTVKVGNINNNQNAELTYDVTKEELVCNKSIRINGSITDSSGLTMEDYVSREGLISTLPAGQTTIRLPASGTYSKFTNTSTSIYRVFTSKWGVNPTDVAPGNGYVQLTFRAQSQDLTVGALCYELKTT